MANPNLDSVLQEFRKSAIPDRLTLLNVTWIEGDDAVEVLAEGAIAAVQKSQSFVGIQAQGILVRYEFAKAGGWLSYGCTIDGERGPVAYFKPRCPRPSPDKIGKFIKYETPQGAEACPILPWVDDETAQAIYQRYGVSLSTGGTFWQMVQRHNLPIAIAEGLKKALALIAHGIPAIAIRGITQWRTKGTNELHPTIAQFATPGRTVHIVFDQDEKASTQKAVREQALKLGAALDKARCKPHIPVWDRQSGKGVDDALFRAGTTAQAWLDGVLESAPSLNAHKRSANVQRALETLARLNTLTYPVERATTGEYLPELPSLNPGTIHALTAATGAGKTTRIRKDWIAQARSLKWLILILSPTNATGQQTAFDADLPHIHNYSTDLDSQAALWADVVHRGGIVLCPDSLHRIPDWFYQRPVLLVLDEANQVLEHMFQGDTLGSRYSTILEKFTTTARHAIATGAIVMAEADLPNRAIGAVKTLSGGQKVRVFTHRKEYQPWDCTLYKGQASGYRALFLEAAKASSRQSGGKHLYVTTSQREGRRMERALAKTCPALKVVRIDSETNQGGKFTEFFEAPSLWLEQNQPDILILSPSAKSGVSIQDSLHSNNPYFSKVWGYFPTLGTDTHMQLLGRYRTSVPRVVFCPDFILSNGDESLLNPRAIRRRLGLNAKAIAGVYGFGELLESEGDVAELRSTIEAAVIDYLSQARAVSGHQKKIAHIALIERLQAAGHSVSSEALSSDQETSTLWKKINEELWREEAQAIASAQITERHTLAWARKALDGLEATQETRLLAQKVIWRDDFPGVPFDDSEECYQALCRDYGAMARGVKLQARAENLEGSKSDDSQITRDILSGNIRALHRLPQSHVRAMLIAQSGVLNLLDGETYGNADPRCQRVKAWALRFTSEISYWLRLQILETQTPIEICHKLLKKMGLERDKEDRPGAIAMMGRKGKRGENARTFRVNLDFNPVRTRLLEAARRKLSESVTSICNKENPSIQIEVTSPEPPPIQGGALVKWGTRLGDWVIEAVHGQVAQVRQATGYASRIVWDAPLSELRAV
jgi:Domain of unknown function (DUF3854)